VQPERDNVLRLEPPAIEVTRLRKVYPGGVEAVKAVDFRVAPGEVFGLLGPNGAGKSTTIGMLTGTIAPTSGTARLAGFDVARVPLDARRASSVVFQGSSSFGWTVTHPPPWLRSGRAGSPRRTRSRSARP
jgi:ABC-2 type transport system ATP-binding protein